MTTATNYYNHNMEEENKGLSDYLAIIRRRKNQLILPALAIFLLSTALALGLPSIYRSTATIIIEQQVVPQDLVRTTVTSFADQRIQVISQRVMTNANLAKIIEDFNLYPEERSQSSMSAVVEKFKSDVQLEMVSVDVVDPRSGRPTEATIAFTLSYDSKSPQMAQKVASEMVTLYLNENLKARAKAAKETSNFLAEEAAKLNEQVSALEAKLAEFKERNVGNLPDMLQLNLQLMERIERQLTDNEQQTRTLEERKIYLQSELAQIDPYSDLYSSTGERIMSTEDELRALQMQYVSRSAQYKENHPTLAMMREKIAALKKEVGGGYDALATLKAQLGVQKSDLAKLTERYSDQHPDVEKLKRAIADTEAGIVKARRNYKPKQEESRFLGRHDNPAYIQLQAQLEAAEAEIRSLEHTREDLKTKIADYEQRLITAPQVEREYRSLTRDYDNAKAKYKEIKSKQMEAELAEALEKDSKSERFDLIESALVPEKPTKPNRLAILILGFVLSFAGGIGNIAIFESMDNTVRGSKGVIAITQAPPLAVIPYIENDQDRLRRTITRVLWFMVILISLTTVAIVIHFLFMPLGEFWSTILDKLGVDASR